jgi:hypothetical protein
MRAYFHNQFYVGIRFRAAITGFVYRKSLKLSNTSKQEATTGEIVNLVRINSTLFYILLLLVFNRWQLMLHDLLK